MFGLFCAGMRFWGGLAEGTYRATAQIVAAPLMQELQSEGRRGMKRALKEMGVPKEERKRIARQVINNMGRGRPLTKGLKNYVDQIRAARSLLGASPNYLPAPEQQAAAPTTELRSGESSGSRSNRNRKLERRVAEALANWRVRQGR
jgi:hypothetical protein